MSSGPTTSVDLDTLAAMRERKRSYKAISNKLGKSRGAVYWQALKHGIDEGKRGPLPDIPTEPVIRKRGNHTIRLFTQAEDAQVLALHAQGMSDGEVAKAVGRKDAKTITARLATLARRQARQEEANGV